MTEQIRIRQRPLAQDGTSGYAATSGPIFLIRPVSNYRRPC